ncbi:N-acetylglucosaminidase [Oceanirhabdus seepicola]|uniref:Glucosaminidase domain-containing protein n=1 Tax=Oceanirhabdus seepicola TaxID=2828781 RepID=A0A9J6P059_9CLOT|nr:glucosaminidase domain-containing protein [Oceanirhabdus seepicola]MCM1989590.1 glucosaminidase domain-containing protein [Oceanirhabdus seepicola]
MRYLKMKIVIMILLLISIPQSVYAKNIKLSDNVSIHKNWTITFNKNVDTSQIENVYVTYANERYVKVKITTNKNKIIVHAPEEGYLYDTTYIINIDKKMQSLDKQSLKESYKYYFTTGSKENQSNINKEKDKENEDYTSSKKDNTNEQQSLKKLSIKYGNKTINTSSNKEYVIGEKVSAKLNNTKFDFRVYKDNKLIYKKLGTSSAEYKIELAGKYKIRITAPKEKKEISFKTTNKIITYEKYYMTLDKFVTQQYNKKSSVYQKNGKWVKASKSQIKEYMNPTKYLNNDNVYQFLTLNYIDGIKVEDVNKLLKGKGTLEGMGEEILKGAKKYNVNPAYVISHMILETGHGKSPLAQGITVKEVDGKKVKSKTVYNMYGIQATDANPNKYGSEYAYKQGWFTPEEAIIEGVKWVGENYINSPKYKQNTLYEMRWNRNVIWHQYSTDIRWSCNQTKRLKDILDKLPSAVLKFEIPAYR